MTARRDLRRNLGGRGLQAGPAASAPVGPAAPDVGGEIHGHRRLRRRLGMGAEDAEDGGFPRGKWVKSEMDFWE